MFQVCCAVYGILLSGAVLTTEEYGRYLWQTPRVAAIDMEATAPLRAELQDEVERILNAGLLAPLRLSYADVPHEAYWLYYERGRMLTTLAYAYPYVTATQQDRIREYAAKTLADPKHAPYLSGILGPTDGAPRPLHGRLVTEGRYISEYGPCPTLHVLYGLWLYGDRSGDWKTLQRYWELIKTRYMEGIESEPILYGRMGAHIAVARLAKRFGDAGALRRASEALAADLDEGRDVSRIAAQLARTRFAHFQTPRNRGSFPGDCWMFLDACPEVLRFLADTQRSEVLRRTELMKARYPLWWLHQAPYFTRWTGDEGVGVTPELIGMIHPVERWVAGTDARRLADFMRSVPVGIGDCYWIEALTRTIEAHGEVQWAPAD
ncbi:hypothetical protein [Thermopirellula anaerolimosa]